MKRKDLVPTQFVRTFGTQTSSYTCMSHPGIDFDEVLAMWLIYLFATLEWLKSNSQNGTIYLGVDGDGQRGVFNEHRARDIGGDQTKCSAILVARSLGLEHDPILQPLLQYALGQDVSGTGSKFDLAAALKAWRSVCWNNEEAIRWTFRGLDVWYEHAQYSTLHPHIWNQVAGGMLDFGRLGLLGGPNYIDWTNRGVYLFSELDRLTAAAIVYVKNTAEPHTVQIGTRRITYWIVRSRADQEFRGCVVSAFRRLGVSAELFINVEDSGHFQVFVPKNPSLLEETFKGITHRIFRNKKWITPEILTKSFLEQMDWVRHKQEGREEAWEKWLYLHPGISCIFNGSQTARPDPLIGDDFALSDLVEIAEAAIIRRNPLPAAPRRPTSAPARRTSPAQPAPQPTSTTSQQK